MTQASIEAPVVEAAGTTEPPPFPPPPPNYAHDGPYGVVAVHESLRVPRKDTGRTLRLALTATVPAVAPGAGAGGGARPPPPHPVCLMLNGFQARAGQYAPLARRLASHGYVVLQYTNPPLTIVPDGAELPFAGAALGWLARAAAREANAALHNRADLSNVFVCGHSRGAKLAALHYAAALANGGRLVAAPGSAGVTVSSCDSAGSCDGGAGSGSFDHGDLAADAAGGSYPLRAAFLMDPVDNTAMTPEGAEYPSACRALAAAGAAVGIAGAGVTGATNPEGSNWRQFWAAAARGSWLGVLPRAGHTRWLMGPWAECWLLDAAFGGGSTPRRAVLDATACLMLGWFDRALRRAGAGSGDPVVAFAGAAAKAACGGGAGGGGDDCAGVRDALQINATAAAAGACDAGPCGGNDEGGEALPPALAGVEALFESGDLVFEQKR